MHVFCVTPTAKSDNSDEENDMLWFFNGEGECLQRGND
jgi:hypothetical protein